MKISIQSLLTLLVILLSSVWISAQDCVDLYFDSSEDGGDLVVQLKVDNFENILISQFALTYSYENLQLTNIEGNSTIELSNTNVFSDIPGYISVSWSNPAVGQTLPDGSVLLELRFAVIVNDVSDFSIDPNFNTEFFDALFNRVCFDASPYAAFEDRSQLVGNLYHDLNGNCIADPTDLPLSGWTVFIDGGLEQYYRVTDAFGNYSIPVEIGSYTVEAIAPNQLWSSCSGPIPVLVIGAGEVIENSFVLSPAMTSSALEVSISSSEVRRCFDNVYSINYKNNGTGVAQNTELGVRLGENLELVDASIGGFIIDGTSVIFDIGNVRPGESGNIQLILNASCDNLVQGQTLCVEAGIKSSNIVIPPVDWGGAVLTTQAECEGDSVAFTIQNIGSAPMDIPLQSIVVEDDIMFGTNEVDLEPFELMKFKHAAFGGVYRVFIDQEEGYPLGNFSTDFIEFCNGGDSETFKFVSMFQIEDESPYTDIECLEVKDNLFTNSMSTFPIGYREEHFINQNEDIEYTVTFQNLTNETVNNIFIENQLDESLDVETLVMGSSSHNFTLTIKEDRKIRVDFKNIQMPAASESDLESIGFVKFRISQNRDVPIGTEIKSTSTIYFDFEDGIETNSISHIVGEEFIEVVLNDEDILLDNEVMVAPNPAVSTMKIELPSSYTNLSYVLYDTKGQVANAANLVENVFYIKRAFLERGMYFLEVRSSNKIIGKKKIVFVD